MFGRRNDDPDAVNALNRIAAAIEQRNTLDRLEQKLDRVATATGINTTHLQKLRSDTAHALALVMKIEEWVSKQPPPPPRVVGVKVRLVGAPVLKSGR